MKNKCIHCQKLFTPDTHHPNAKTCSKKCCKAHRYLQIRKNILKYPKEWKTKKHCEHCNKLIKFNRDKPIRSELARRFCCIKCRRAVANIKRKKHILKEKKCLYCGGVFTPHYLHPQARLCSPKCQQAHKWYNKYRVIISKYPKGFDTIKKCKRCGNQIIFDKTKPMNTELIRNYCSKSCRNKEGHQRWKRTNPKGYKAQVRRFRQSEKGKIAHRFHAKKRRYKLKNNIITNFTIKEQQELKSKGICFGYGIKPHYVGKDNLEIDHKYPVSKASKDFLKTGKKRVYTIKDVQPLCRDCNQKKLDRLD